MIEHAEKLRSIVRSMGQRTGYRVTEAMSELDALLAEHGAALVVRESSIKAEADRSDIAESRLAAAREEGRREGFEKAREMAAAACQRHDDAADTTTRRLGDAFARRIRAMKDEQ